MSEAEIRRLPEARKDGLLVEELGSELLIYDVETDRAHCLSPTAALVWKHCDGTQSAASVANLLAEGEEEELVWRAVEELDELRLLSARATPSVSRGWSRRDILVRLGVAAAAAPLVQSIVAPPAEAQATCRPRDAPCTAGAQCCSGNCRGNGLCN